MKNFEQIRAKNALSAAINKKDFKGQEGGEATVKKVATMILDNGILATAAFSKDKESGYKTTFDAIIEHLKDKEIGILPEEIHDLDSFIDYLSEKIDSGELRRITAETMAYMNYLRRFV